MNIGAILTAGLLSLSVPLVLAQTDVDTAIEYRQGVYRAMEWNLTPLAAMVQGRSTFDADEFTRRAERILRLGRMVEEGFDNAASTRGDTIKTRASYKIWDDRARFDEQMQEMQTRSRALYGAAVAGQARDDLRPLLGRLAQSCKACHDRFRD